LSVFAQELKRFWVPADEETAAMTRQLSTVVVAPGRDRAPSPKVAAPSTFHGFPLSLTPRKARMTAKPSFQETGGETVGSLSLALARRQKVVSSVLPLRRGLTPTAVQPAGVETASSSVSTKRKKTSSGCQPPGSVGTIEPVPPAGVPAPT
jgi:hypothetical protein